jgi:hypothetical protein
MWINSIIFCFAILLQAQSVIAQQVVHSDSERIFMIEPKFQTGTIVNNNEKAQLLVKDNPWLVQVDLSVLKNTKRSWDYSNCYTQTGVSLSYINFGNPAKLGKAVSFSVYTEPYLVLSPNVKFTIRGGAGFAYLNKVYDVKYDSNNLFYSKPLSFILSVGTSLKYRIAPATHLTFAAQFNHISNGGTRWPNWGMNFPMVGMGVTYAFQHDDLKKRERIEFDDKSWKIITHVFGGRNTEDAKGKFPEAKRLVTGINVGLIKPLGKISSLGVGGEAYYDGIAHLQEERTGKDYRAGIASVSLQHYITFGKLLLGQQLAYYVTKVNPDVARKLYQRYFIEYKVKGPLYLGVSLKAHGNVSDYITLSTAYIFNTRAHK